MKRIKNADINFKLNPKRINLNNFSMKFYTVNSQAYFFTKDQDNVVSVEREATIYDDPEVIISGGTVAVDYYLPLDWSELVQLGEGVLNYRCINNIEDPFFPDLVYNQVVEDTTAYYIDSDIHIDPADDKNLIERVVELESNLAVETADREDADVFLSGAVDTEIARAVSAETELSERIDAIESGASEALDAEIERAISAETALQDAIDDEEARAIAIENAIRQDLTDESELRSSADTAMWTAINDEIVRSTSAETALDNKIDVENLRAIGVENAISGNLETYKATANAALQAETTRATSAETALQTAIGDEATARANADAALGTRIDNISSASTAAIEAEAARAREAESGLTNAINNEVTRATSAETIIANSLNTEVTRATSAETALNNQIDAEVLRATAAEAELEAKIGVVSGVTELINAETLRATTAENALSGAIDSISAATSGSVEELDAKIDQEITDRTADVDAEEARAKGVENALSGAIDTLDVRFFDDAKYEDSGNTKVINFYNGNVVKATIDCTDFLVDGMIDDVYIENGYLVIDFNTASGKQDIRIPLTDIFNPANYYTKSETSGATEISSALAEKLDVTAYTPTDLSNYYTKDETSGKTEIANAIDAVSGAIPTQYVSNIGKNSDDGHTRWFDVYKNGVNSLQIYNFSINGRMPLTKQNGTDANIDNFNLVETSDFTAHTADSVAHITAAERTAWNAKADESAFTAHTSDSTIHLTSGTVQTQINESISGKANSSDVYLKTETSGATEISTALAGKSDTGHTHDDRYYTKSETSGATEISSALADKLDATAYTPTDLSNYYTKSETSGATEIATALSGKQDTLSAGTNITISGNVISAEGGGKAISAGTNISVTTGETADTINCTLPIKTNAWNSLTFNSSRNPLQVLYASAFGDYTTASGKGSFAIGKDTTASGEYSFVGGYNSSQAKGNESFSFGDGTVTNKKASVAFGRNITTNNECEFSCGKLNKSVSASTTFGNSGNTLFSVGNGISSYHNAFEIRQNGDIYISSGGTDILLQDHLGGGGGSITSGEVQTMITSATTPIYQTIEDNEQVTAAALNVLNAAVSGKASQSDLETKQDTLVSGTNIKTINNESILGSGNINIQGGGGKTIEAGRGIAITTGETADTVSFNLPISGGSGTNSIIIGAGETGYAGGGLVHGIGSSSNGVYSNVFGYNCFSNGNYSFLAGGYLNNYKEYGVGFGKYNSTTNSPLFSVGNGTANDARHNAFEIRENGDIYLSSGGTDIKLQDYLGGGGSSINVVQTTGSSTTDVMSQAAVTSAIPTIPTSNTAFTNDAQYATSGYVDSVVSGKADSSSLATVATSGSYNDLTNKLSAGTNITIVDNVISATGGGGGGSYTAGRGINITSDVISVSLPISAGTGNYSIIEGGSTSATSECAHAEGWYTKASGARSHAEGYGTVADSDNAHVEGYYTIANNNSEHACGKYNVSRLGPDGSYTTLFTVGNGTAENARHNAFEIRGNGDIYFEKNGSDVKLQDVIPTTTSAVTSGSTAVLTSGGAYEQFGGLKLVKLTQTQYDNLQNKDNNTLYVIVG